MKRILRCHCGNTLEISYANEGDTIRAGWQPIGTFDGEIVRLCPTCLPKAISLAQELVNIVGNEYIFIGSLINAANRRNHD